MKSKSVRICTKCGDYHEVTDTRTYETGTIRRTMVCSQCGNREYSFEYRIKKIESVTLTKRDRDLIRAMDLVG